MLRCFALGRFWTTQNNSPGTCCWPAPAPPSNHRPCIVRRSSSFCLAARRACELRDGDESAENRNNGVPSSARRTHQADDDQRRAPIRASSPAAATTARRRRRHNNNNSSGTTAATKLVGRAWRSFALSRAGGSKHRSHHHHHDHHAHVSQVKGRRHDVGDLSRRRRCRPRA